MSEVFTYGTLALELGLAVLVWNRALRPWILGLGVALHLVIDLSILVGFFSFTILTAYVAFTTPSTASRLILRVRDRMPPRHPRPTISEARTISIPVQTRRRSEVPSASA